MTLTLSILRCPDNVAPETRTILGGEFSIGRGPENDWVLPDPERGLSKRHCVLAFRAGGWQVADLSTNGTFVNRDSEPIGRGEVRELRDGDRLSFGAYEIEVHIDAATQHRPAEAPAASPALFALDPFAPPAGQAAARSLVADPLLGGLPGEDPFASALGSGSAGLPADYDPLAPEPVPAELRRTTQSDHTPHIEDAFAPPPVRPVLPADWDREADPSASAPAAAAPAAMAAAAIAVAAATPVLPPQPAGPAPPAPEMQRSDDDLFAAFLRGAGLTTGSPAASAAVMEALGAAFRALVAGLRQTMMARAAVKDEFRIEQTMIRARGNNPLKFSADDEDALRALLGVGRHSDMKPAEAIADALRDIRLHELATVAAMQSAIRALLAEFDPAGLRQAAEHGGLSLMPAQRKARAWDAFGALHARVTQALADDFDSIFGKAFARAYERALAEISAKEPAVIGPDTAP